MLSHTIATSRVLIRILHSLLVAVFPLLLTQTHMHPIIPYHIISYHIISYHVISYHIISYILIASQFHFQLPTTRKTCWLRTRYHLGSHIAHRKLPMSRCVFVLQSTLSTARISLACIAALVLLPIPPPSPREAGAEGPDSCSTSTWSLMIDRNMA